MPDEWITVNKAVSISGYHPDHIRRLVRAGEIDARKFGPVWQVNHKSLLAYLRKVQALGERRGPKRE